jgi:FtsH-binding integral membrane protein
MTRETRRHAGILIVILPTVIYGGVSILGFLIHDPAYMQNPLRQNLFRAGHAHAGVLLILSLVAYLYVDDANLSPIWKTIVKAFIPSAAIFLPAAFFFSVLSADATKANGFIYLAYVGVALLVTGLLALGIGLIRSAKNR